MSTIGGIPLKEIFSQQSLTKKSQFNFDLPPELIAQSPIEPRDASKLLVLDKTTGTLKHQHFKDIINFINKGDCLILNNSKVLPARIFGNKLSSENNCENSKLVEFLLLKQVSNNSWETLVKPGKKAKCGTSFSFGDGKLIGKITDVKEDGNRIIEFKYEGNFFNILDEIGQMPLPPYIKESLKNKSRYQTVYAKDLGSAAAPTAGLHFTPELLDKLKEKGVNIGFVTLHVGLGTFRPVQTENINEHKMHSEHYFMSEETAEIINNTKQNGGKVIAVGTTSCRTLETIASKNNCIKSSEGWTDIFIHPGYEFKCMDGLITNFHLPESTLIMLVSAFAGYENTMNAYKTAVDEKYRFFSFGDAMMII